MEPEPQRLVPSFSMSRLLNWVLGLQLAIAALLIVADLDLGMGQSDLPADFEISPGDQKRRFITTQPVIPADMNLPDEIQERLAFSLQSFEGYGDVLLLSGEIQQGDAVRFLAHWDSLQAKPKVVALHSQGGSVYDALEIGRAVRELGLDTLIPTDAFCMSACPYILAGGVGRAVAEGGIVGLHQHYFDTPKYLPAYWAVETIQYGQGETLSYLSEMGIDPVMLVFALQTPPDEIYILVREELQKFNVVTDQTS